MKKIALEESIKWYDSHVQHYADQANKRSPRSQMNDFIRFLPNNADVLDAGCGTGRECDMLYKKGFRVTGLDLSAGLISFAQKAYPHISFVRGNFLHLPFSREAFDGVWSHTSLVHLETIEDVDKALKEFNRVLKPKGILHLMVKAEYDNKKFAVLRDKRTNDDRFFQFFSKKELEILTMQNGFEKLKLYQFKDVRHKEKYNFPQEWIVYLGRKSDSKSP